MIDEIQTLNRRRWRTPTARNEIAALEQTGRVDRAELAIHRADETDGRCRGKPAQAKPVQRREDGVEAALTAAHRADLELKTALPTE